jgi:hypothetical protein
MIGIKYLVRAKFKKIHNNRGVAMNPTPEKAIVSSAERTYQMCALLSRVARN